MRVLLIFILIFLFNITYSQQKDYNKYDKAIKLFNKNEFDKAKNILNKIIEKNSDWDKPYLLLSTIYLKENDLYSSSKSLLNIYDIENPDDYLGIEKIALDFYKNDFRKFQPPPTNSVK